jgi:hypothetical protein
MTGEERVRAVYIAAEAAHRVLCRLEDELDALDPEDEIASAAPSLLIVASRWNHDTARKILRTLEAAGVAT